MKNIHRNRIHSDLVGSVFLVAWIRTHIYTFYLPRSRSSWNIKERFSKLLRCSSVFFQHDGSATLPDITFVINLTITCVFLEVTGILCCEHRAESERNKGLWINYALTLTNHFSLAAICKICIPVITKQLSLFTLLKYRMKLIISNQDVWVKSII